MSNKYARVDPHLFPFHTYPICILTSIRLKNNEIFILHHFLSFNFSPIYETA